MKKILLMAAAAVMSLSAMATDLFVGSKHVSWGDGGLQLAASNFATAKPGDKIAVTYTGASDGIEFKVMNANFDHLAGSRESFWISGNETKEQFLTPDAVDSLKLYGLEIIGANFTVTKVELSDGKATLPEGYVVWTGYFWADQWSTLELYSDSYRHVDWSAATAIRFYSEAASPSYILNFMQSWEGDGKFADQTNMTVGDGYLELALTPELRSRIASAPHWMIQYNRESVDAFNVTDVVVVMPTNTTGLNEAATGTKAVKRIEDGKVVIYKNGVRYNTLGVAY